MEQTLSQTTNSRWSPFANLNKVWHLAFGKNWDELPWDKKLAWLLFVSNTLAVITLTELLFLGK